MNNISIYTYIERSISLLRWSLSLTVAIIMTIIFGLVSLQKLITFEQKILQGLSPHLAYLIETNDRTEILRLLSSASKVDSSKLVLIVDSQEFANSYDITKLDTPYNPGNTLFRLFESDISKTELSISNKIKKNATSRQIGVIKLSIPLRRIFSELILTLTISFSLCMTLLYLLSRKIEHHLKRALQSLHSLDNEIKNLHNEEFSSQKLEFIELEKIRLAIIKAKFDLREMNDKLANQKAKEINSEVYRRLIHDLQNPITALKTMISLISEDNTDGEIKKEALEVVPNITEEILLQILAAKRNFEYDVHTFKNIDLRICLSETLSQLKASKPEIISKICYNPPQDPIFLPCDPTNIKRAVINLVENGVEACKDKLEIRLAQNQHYTSIFISDDGIGIEESKLKEILLGRSVSNKGNRQALGLSSVNHIVKSHNGELIYQKSKFGGAEFELRIGELC